MSHTAQVKQVVREPGEGNEVGVCNFHWSNWAVFMTQGTPREELVGNGEGLNEEVELCTHGCQRPAGSWIGSAYVQGGDLVGGAALGSQQVIQCGSHHIECR